MVYLIQEIDKSSFAEVHYRKEQTWSIQRRRAGDHYYYYDLGTETADKRRLGRFLRTLAYLAHVYAQFFVYRDLLGESSYHYQSGETRQLPDIMVQHRVAFRDVIHTVRNGVDR